MVYININLLSEFAYEFLEYLNKYSKNLKFEDFIKNDQDDDEILLIASTGEFNIEHNNIKFDVKYEQKGDPIAINNTIDYYKELTIECKHHDDRTKDIEEIKKLFYEIKKDIREPLKDRIRIYIPNNTRWEKLTIIPKRDLTTIFLDNLNDITDDINNFMNSEDEYIKRGVKYKRNYLLYGPPGTGKTSVITSIASKYDLDIFMMSLSNQITDIIFMKLISKLPNKSLLVLEDIDCLFSHRNEKNNLNFSTILNTLDGFACKNRMITFMTTNHKNKLDSALIRPGRIDYVYEFSYATKKQTQEMFISYFPENNSFEILYKKIQDKKITTAALQKFFFENRNNENIIDKLDLLDDLVDQYKSYNNMYC
jgi:chaperone BCS1